MPRRAVFHLLEGTDGEHGLDSGLYVVMWVSNDKPLGGRGAHSIVEQLRRRLGNKTADPRRAPVDLKNIFLLVGDAEVSVDVAHGKVKDLFAARVLREQFELKGFPVPAVSGTFYEELTTAITAGAAYATGQATLKDAVRDLERALGPQLRRRAQTAPGASFRCTAGAEVQLWSQARMQLASVAFGAFRGKTVEEEDARCSVVPDLPEAVLSDNPPIVQKAYEFHKQLWQVAMLCGRDVRLLPLVSLANRRIHVSAARSMNISTCVLCVSAYFDCTNWAQAGNKQLYLFIKMQQSNEFTVQIRKEARSGKFHDHHTANADFVQNVPGVQMRSTEIHREIRELMARARRMFVSETAEKESKVPIQWVALEGALVDMYGMVHDPEELDDEASLTGSDQDTDADDHEPDIESDRKKDTDWSDPNLAGYSQEGGFVVGDDEDNDNDASYVPSNEQEQEQEEEEEEEEALR